MRDLKKAFIDGCNCTRDGAGAAALSHIGCVLSPAIAGLFGGSLSHGFMAAAMYVSSPLIAVGATWGLDHMQGKTVSIKKLGGSAAIALTIAFGLNQFIGHEHHGGEHLYEDILKDQEMCRAPRLD